MIRETAPGFAAAQVVVKPKKTRPFYGGHPWVLDSAIARVEGTAADGDPLNDINPAGWTPFLMEHAASSETTTPGPLVPFYSPL